MGWVFLEALVALLIAVGIVWWTWPEAPQAAAREPTTTARRPLNAARAAPTA